MAEVWSWPKRERDWRRARRLAPGRPVTVRAGTGGIACRHVVWPMPALAGCRLVFVTDLHHDVRDLAVAGRVSAGLAATVAAWAPDWLVFGGDLARHLDGLDAALAVLAGLPARCARLAVLGNWERQHTWLAPEFWRAGYRTAGWTLLVNEDWTAPADAGLRIVGLDEPRNGVPDLGVCAAAAGAAAAAAAPFTVTVSHSPDALANSGGRSVGDLVLAGHTHGGQIRLPLLGAMRTSSEFWKHFELGWYERRRDRTPLLISAGLGCVGPWLFRRRFGCPPEVVVIEFVATAPE